MKRQVVEIIALLVLVGVALTIDAGYGRASGNDVGAAWCQSCHPNQHAAWQEGPHAGALFVLDAERRNDSKCVGCHSTQSADPTAGVECESCHGGGAHYAKDYVMRDAKLAEALGLKAKPHDICMECHNCDQPKIREFHPGEAWKRLPHARTAGQ